MVIVDIKLHGETAANRAALIDEADFELASKYRWELLEWTDDQGRRHGPYAYCRSAPLRYMHRLIMPGVPMIDHRDGNGLNNTRGNLRPATPALNNANQKLRRNSVSGLKGVSWDSCHNKWRAQVWHKGTGYRIGYFATREAAGYAYDRKAVELAGEYARTNQMLGLLPPETRDAKDVIV